jgi:hypothetical protein
MRPAWPGHSKPRTKPPHALACPPLPPRRCVFLNYYALFRKPILVALNAADTARGIEAASDEAVVADVMKACGRAGLKLLTEHQQSRSKQTSCRRARPHPLAPEKQPMRG